MKRSLVVAAEATRRGSRRRLRRSLLFGVAALALVGVGICGAIFLKGRSDNLGASFALAASDGRRVDESTFRGKWELSYFGYT